MKSDSFLLFSRLHKGREGSARLRFPFFVLDFGAEAASRAATRLRAKVCSAGGHGLPLKREIRIIFVLFFNVFQAKRLKIGWRTDVL